MASKNNKDETNSSSSSNDLDLEQESEHQLGRINLSGDENEIDIVETSESDDEDDELNDFDDPSDQFVEPRRTTPRRHTSMGGISRSRSPIRSPPKHTFSSGSRKYRRTSAKPTTTSTGMSSSFITSSSSSSNIWRPRQDTQVDQSVNLMDAKTLPSTSSSNQDASRGGGGSHRTRVRPTLNQLNASIHKSMVDVFLGGDRPQTRGGGGKDSGDYGMQQQDLRTSGKSRLCRNLLLLVVAVSLLVVLVVTVPQFGLVASMASSSSDNDSNANNQKTTKPPTPEIQPTNDITTDSGATPQQQPEEEIQEETELPPRESSSSSAAGQMEENVDRPLPEPEIPLHHASRYKALEFLLVDQDVTEQAQLDMEGSPANKALHWMTQRDPAQYPIPGLDANMASQGAEDALLQRYALAVFYFSMQQQQDANPGAGNHVGKLLRTRTLQQQEQQEQQPSAMEVANRERFDNDWLSVNHICLWHGIKCDDDLESVTQVQLSGHLLRGTIPRELLVAMPYLKRVDLTLNQLKGTLPDVTPKDRAGVSKQKAHPTASLQRLEVADNRLTGSLDNLVGLSKLEFADLSRNQFTGRVPLDIMDMTDLEDLRANENRISGSLPGRSLGDMSSLRVLEMVNNRLTGKIPTHLNGMTKLQQLSLSSNQLSGEIPSELGDMIHLEHLDLDGNDLAGKVPTQLGRLFNLNRMQLEGNNQLTGEMPQEICGLVDAKSLTRLFADCAADDGTGKFICDCCTYCF